MRNHAVSNFHQMGTPCPRFVKNCLSLSPVAGAYFNEPQASLQPGFGYFVNGPVSNHWSLPRGLKITTSSVLSYFAISTGNGVATTKICLANKKNDALLARGKKIIVNKRETATRVARCKVPSNGKKEKACKPFAQQVKLTNSHPGHIMPCMQ